MDARVIFLCVSRQMDITYAHVHECKNIHLYNEHKNVRSEEVAHVHDRGRWRQATARTSRLVGVEGGLDSLGVVVNLNMHSWC